MSLKNYLKQVLGPLEHVFCQHEYTKTGWEEAEDQNLRYSIRHYTCEKCGRNIIQDGRCDPYQK